MEKLTKVAGIAVPMLQANIDTDQIIPVPEMTRSTEETHERWGAGLFAYWRYVGDRQPNPDFILNREPWSRATILLADRNFGCGSSREPAPKALRGYGFRAVIAPSFSGIFFGNSFRNGLLPVELPIEQVREIARQMEEAQGNAQVTVDLERQEVTAPDGRQFRFDTPAPLRRMLLTGLNEIDQTLEKLEAIQSYWNRDAARRPWVYAPGAAATRGARP
ncbi:MAG: 3-isopropylmalate dehydratase small subunit [Alphaproteobacteria bacterium]